jgi:hypothetical protein
MLTSARSLKYYKIFITISKQVLIVSKGGGKAIPLQAWTGPEGSRRLQEVGT